ncbi:hypothetical protein Acr_00g0085650 [Actinidia rufa]|uniref:Uncharacterized protein n=1 Tax=Actinidia rufa TaxID=165716 RepID=A0A7J0DVW0_9ERIC|nr:hypothetical protein Acr_00g0085650 [Actinidia rufa]
MEFSQRRLSQKGTEGTTVIPPLCRGPRDHGRGYPCLSISGCGWIWRPMEEEIKEKKMVAKPGRWREEGEEIREMAISGPSLDAKQGVKW